MSGNNVTLTFAADTSKLDKAMAGVGASADSMKAHVDEAGGRLGALSERTDNIASKSSIATGAFGALGSGVQLLNAKSETRKQKLAAENAQISAQISLLQTQTDKSGKVTKAAQAQITALQAKQGANDRESAALDQHEQKYQDVTNALMMAALATDALSGVTDLLTLATKSNVVITGIAKAATAVWTGAQWLLNAALSANPIGIVVVAITALIAVIVLIATKTHWFQDIWKATWGGIRDTAEAVGHWFADTLWGKWIKGTFDKMVGFIEGLPARFGKIGGHLWDWLQVGLKGALNGAISLLNMGIDAVNAITHGLSDAWTWAGIPAIPQIPHIPKLHGGGIVPGAPGSETLAILQAGERVTPAGAAGPGVVYVAAGDAVTAAVFASIREHIATRYGGDVTIALAGAR